MNIPQTIHTKILQRNIFTGVLLFFCANLFLAQNKISKLSTEFLLPKIPLFKLNTSHTQVKFSTWDQNKIEINAYVDGDASDEYLQNASDIWELQIQSSDSIFIINSDASKQLPRYVISEYSATYDNPQNRADEIITAMLQPLINRFQSTSIPIALQKRLNSIQFDFNAYNNLGETYIRIWENNLVKDLDSKTIKEVKNWSKEVTSKLINLPKQSKKTTQTNVNNRNITYFESYTVSPNIPVKKVIEIKIPNKSNTFISSRYGSFESETTLTNIKGKLKYTPFKATTIMGENTDLQIFFAPVQIKNWHSGHIDFQYVKSGEIGSVDSIDLTAKSSKILIYSLIKNANIKTSFSKIGIDKTSSSINQLSILGQNCDIVIQLPDTAFNFAYSGEMSSVKIPENKLKVKSLGDYKNLMINGYQGSRNTNKEIQMNVANSLVILK